MPETNKQSKPGILQKIKFAIFYLSQRYFSLGEKQKVFIALILTILIIGGFFTYVSGGFNFRKEDTAVLGESDFLELPEVKQNLQKLKDIKESLNPESLIYDRIKYEDLPIYPTAWVERTFSQTEIKNALVSGPAGDPDGDGLTNKQEYLFGSDPKNPLTLCQQKGCDLNDKQNVDRGISPLTGEQIESNREIILTKQDTVYIQSLQESFETASKEGVDFPVLYQESTKIDLSNQLDQESFLVVDQNRESVTAYIELRLKVLDNFLSKEELDSAIGSLLTIYQASKIEELEKIDQRYSNLLDELRKAPVPQGYEKMHKGLVLLIKKLKDMINHRKEGIQNNLFEDKNYQSTAKSIAVEVVWSYRAIDLAAQELEND